MFCREHTTWHKEDDAKTAFWGESEEKYQRKNLIKKESGEEQYFGSTDEPNQIMPNNPFIDQEMNCETTNKNDETSETLKGDAEKQKFRKFLYARAVHVLNVYRINSILQAERLSVIEGYKELVKQDSSLMPLESSRFREDDEIVGITISMIEKDVMLHNDHHQQAIQDIMLLQQQLFNQTIERNIHYKKNPNIKNKKKQEKHDDWKKMVDIERYHVMSEKEIL